MPLSTTTACWNDWMLNASKSDLFSFLSITGEENQDQGNGDGAGDGVGGDQTEDVAIDDEVFAPLLCKSTSTEHTQYLQSLVLEGMTTARFSGQQSSWWILWR